MTPALRTVLVGRQDSRFQRTLGVLFAVGISVATFVAYALDLFAATGGVIVLPGDATLVGFVAAVGIGTRRGGLAFAWLAQFAAYVGFRADWAFLGLSSHSPAGKLAFFFDPVGLAVFAVAAVLIGTIGFGVGALGRWSIDRLRDRVTTNPQ
jgi:hypothetical protein